jgi:hypothetical protein
MKILRKLPARYAGIVMPFFLSVLMTCVISMISTLRGVGWGDAFLEVWPSSWGLSWVVSFPVLLVVLPIVRRLTALIVQSA